MGYYKVKSIKIDKENNKIKGVIADSNLRDYNDNFIYNEVDDLYPTLEVLEDKIASLYYDLICGNFHTSLKKYTDYVLIFDLVEDFTDDFRETYRKSDRKAFDLYNVYLKHKDNIDKYTKKDCILREKDYQNRYIVRVNKRSVSINYGKEKAKKFNSALVKNNTWYMDNFEIEYI